MAFLANSTFILQISYGKTFKMRYIRCRNNNFIRRYSQFHFMYGSNFYESDFICQFECSVHIFRGPWLRSQITMADEAIIRLHLQPETEIQSILRVPLSEAMVAFVEKWGFVLQQHLVMQNQIRDLQLGFNQPLDLPHQIILRTVTHLSFFFIFFFSEGSEFSAK